MTAAADGCARAAVNAARSVRGTSLVVAAQGAVDAGEQQGGLAALRVDRLHRGPGLAGDRLHRRAQVALADEERGGRVEHRGAGGLGLRPPQGDAYGRPECPGSTASVLVTGALCRIRSALRQARPRAAARTRACSRAGRAATVSRVQLTVVDHPFARARL